VLTVNDSFQLFVLFEVRQFQRLVVDATGNWAAATKYTVQPNSAGSKKTQVLGKLNVIIHLFLIGIYRVIFIRKVKKITHQHHVHYSFIFLLCIKITT